MKYFTGIDVSLRSVSICVVDEVGRLQYETKVPAEVELSWQQAQQVARLHPVSTYDCGLVRRDAKRADAPTQLRCATRPTAMMPAGWRRSCAAAGTAPFM